MADQVKIVNYFYATVGDKPGEARRLLEHLSEKGVNLLAFTAFPVEENRSQLDFFPENPGVLQEAARDAGIELVGPKRAFLIQGEDRVGALLDNHLKLANANINVHAANGTSAGSGRYGYILWVRPEQFSKAAEALMGAHQPGQEW
jgi:hypothetical protein